ncbi:ssDNA-binding protein, mitochondrial [Tilletia horrida]|uniref:Single-stranded DNA-binding protein n=1 Tax=Tilletia horrida TaxID=155126 RepID=A0AAN6GKT2_9BASI|nr:ssDNA-binding protein, mitochondrial [Tilletia horrida]KAK0546759.1 ssDNA-binding protein, mitochondrial [Tilletia horrida]
MSFVRSLARTASQAARQQTAAFSTSTAARDVARIQLVGRLVADPEVKATRSGKDYVSYTVATTDPVGPPAEDGSRPEPTTSYHRIFAFGENSVQRLTKITKGTQVLVDADFRISRTPATEEGQLPRDQLLVQHRSISVLSRPKTQSEASA